MASWSGQGASAAVTWNGASGGRAVPDGAYTAELTATTDGGVATGASAQITVDTAAPRLSGASVAPASFSPNGDGQTGERGGHVQRPPRPAASASGSWTGTARSSAGSTAGSRGRARRTPSRGTAASVSGGSLTAAPDGLYRFDVERRDAAGNVARRASRSGSTGRSAPRPRPRHDLSRRRRRHSTPRPLGFTLAQGRRHGRLPRRQPSSARSCSATSPPVPARSAGRADGLRRVPRQLAARLHRHADSLPRREQRDRPRRGPLPPESSTHARKDVSAGDVTTLLQARRPVQREGGRALRRHRRPRPSCRRRPPRLAVGRHSRTSVPGSR